MYIPRQPDVEHAPLADVTLGPDRPTMQFDDAFAACPVLPFCSLMLLYWQSHASSCSAAYMCFSIEGNAHVDLTKRAFVFTIRSQSQGIRDCTMVTLRCGVMKSGKSGCCCVRDVQNFTLLSCTLYTRYPAIASFQHATVWYLVTNSVISL